MAYFAKTATDGWERWISTQQKACFNLVQSTLAYTAMC
jgi:hypothetical protein